MLYVVVMEEDGFLLSGVWRTREAAVSGALNCANRELAYEASVVGELQEAREMLATFDGTHVWVGQLSNNERFFVYEMDEED